VQGRLADVIGIREEETAFGSEDEDIRKRLVVGIAPDVGVTTRIARNAAKRRDVRRRSPVDEQEERGRDADEEARQRIEDEDAEQRSNGSDKVGAYRQAESPADRRRSPSRARGVPSMRTTATIGRGLTATPTAAGSVCPIAWPTACLSRPA